MRMRAGLMVAVVAGAASVGCGAEADPAGVEAPVGQETAAVTTAPGVHLWSKRFGDAHQQWVEDVATDAEGNVVTVGMYGGSNFDVGNGPLPATSYYYNLYLAKFDGEGNALWSRAIPGINDDDFGFVEYKREVATDPAGNILIAGNYYGTPDFGCGPLPLGLASVFAVKLNANGQCVWSQGFPGAMVDHPRLAAIGSGGLALAGIFHNGTLNFGGAPLTASGRDIFLARLDDSGNHVWSKRFEATGGGHFADALGLAADHSGKVLLTGGFSGYASFGASAMRSRGGMDLFIARFNGTGGLMWGRRFGDASNQVGYDVATDANGDIVITGGFGGVLNIDGHALTARSSSDAFLVKLDSTGHHVWGQRFTGFASVQHGTQVALDSQGNITTSGNYTGHIDLGAGPLDREGVHRRYVARFTSTGQLVWQLDFVSDGYNLDVRVAVDPAGDALVGGHFAGSTDFHGGTFQTQGDHDIFLGKYTQH